MLHNKPLGYPSLAKWRYSSFICSNSRFLVVVVVVVTVDIIVWRSNLLCLLHSRRMAITYAMVKNGPRPQRLFGRIRLTVWSLSELIVPTRITLTVFWNRWKAWSIRSSFHLFCTRIVVKIGISSWKGPPPFYCIQLSNPAHNLFFHIIMFANIYWLFRSDIIYVDMMAKDCRFINWPNNGLMPMVISTDLAVAVDVILKILLYFDKLCTSTAIFIICFFFISLSLSL